MFPGWSRGAGGRGLAEQVGDRGKHRLGVGLISLAGAVSDGLDFTQQGRPVCERLGIAERGETVNLGVMQGQCRRLNVDQVAEAPTAGVDAQLESVSLTPLAHARRAASWA